MSEARLRALNLPAVARHAVAESLGVAPPHRVEPRGPDLGPVGASFVTIRVRGALRGCVGGTEPRVPVVQDVAHHARAAAFRDTRFRPVRASELGELRFEVSVLEPPRPLAVGGYTELLEALRPFRDGLLVDAPAGRGLFLPQVWQQLPESVRFVEALWQKAGLRPGQFEPGFRVSTFAVWKFEEVDDG